MSLLLVCLLSSLFRPYFPLAMASGGTPLQPPPQPPPSISSLKSWAQVASSGPRPFDSSPLQNPPLLAKLKSSTSEFVCFDSDALAHAQSKFQHSLFGKFFGKPSLFDQVKTFLTIKWAEFGEVFISNFPNGFLLIRCASHSIMQHLLCDGPWTINGIIL